MSNRIGRRRSTGHLQPAAREVTPPASPPRHRPTPRHRRPWWRHQGVVVGGIVVLAVLGLMGIFVLGRGPAAGGGAASRYATGSPGSGQTAPGFDLPSTSGGTITLSSYRGQTVMLFFQEGIGCEPCWQQIKDVETATQRLKGAGIDAFVTITTNDLGQLRRKVADEGIHTAVLADTDFTVSHAYNANQYGMMGSSADGHTFIVVGPDGTIEWRADYGGAPNYTMYVSIDQLLSDFSSGRRTS